MQEVYYYTSRYRGRFLYLDRQSYGYLTHIFRLEYQGAIDNWQAAVFKYSRNSYDPEECFFPGWEVLDGSISGAMLAGLKVYP